ncbi:ComEA family DNA-binding protein [Microbacterium bovistercoris]|uniref:ComEA family DNA-binding protein n=1 Tax=Microbacterium bovistercoris TaxID=2293570 RepID=A0A371NQQ0_9MICO|nr:ComEA family DNA-binding protein [Microbacterium bovistercoris]REJ04498.1 ComEA family DNA-binding protein [Microbacterium bovistercoris]
MPTPDAPDPALARRRLRLSIGAAVVLGLIVLSAAVGWGILRGQASPAAVVPLEEEARSGAPAELYVHVLGEVAKPGLYVLETDARLVDALAAAGGTTDAADLAAVNLARPLSDGEQVIVPPKGTPAADGAAQQPGDGLVDLNSADQAALEGLPRIGPALAERIIAWRDDNGRFRSVDDLLAVPGIGEKLLDGLRDLVRV